MLRGCSAQGWSLRGGGGRARGGHCGRGVGVRGNPPDLASHEWAFLERTQSPIHRSPQGISLNKYGQRFSPIWKPSLPISQRKQASQRRIEVSPRAEGHFRDEGCEMQMWVKNAAANKLPQTCGKMGGGACPSPRLLTFLTSTQTASFPTSRLWVL